MEILLFFILYVLPPLLPVLFGMIFGLLVLMPNVRNWNQSYRRKAITSLGLACIATLVFQFLAAYGNAQFTIYVSRMMNALVIDNLLNGSRDQVEKELFMRGLYPRLDLQPCYSAQEKICEAANTVEIYANEGYVPPLKESIIDYLQSTVIVFLSVWVGSLLAVLRLTTMKQKDFVSA
jgi:hypothetical protein